GDGAAAGADGAHVQGGRPDGQVADRGFAADAGREPLDQGDVSGGAAHVEGQDVGVAGLLGDPGRAGDTTRGPGQQERDGAVGRDRGGHQAAVAAQDRQVGVQARAVQLALQVADVAGDLALDVRVGDRGEGP